MRSKKIYAAALAAVLTVGSASVAALNAPMTVAMAASSDTPVANNGAASVASGGTVKVASDCSKITLTITGVTTGLTATSDANTDPSSANEICVPTGYTYDATNGTLTGDVSVTATAQASQNVSVTYKVFESDAVAEKTVTATITKEAAASSTEYNVTAPGSVTGGTVSVDKTTAAEGATVTITATPTDAEKNVAVVTVKQGTTTISTTKGTDNKFTFAMPAGDVTISVEFVDKSTLPDEGSSSSDASTSTSTSDSDASTSEGDTSTSEGDTSTDTSTSESTPSESTPSQSTPSGSGTVTFPSNPSSGNTSNDNTSTTTPALPEQTTKLETETSVSDDFSADDKAVVEKVEFFTPADTFPEGTVPNIKPNTAVSSDDGFALDITFVNGDKTVQPKDGAAVTVAVPVPAAFANVDASTLKVFFFDGSKYTEITGVKVVDGVLKFTTDHFSTYVISTKNLAEKNTPANNGGNTDNNNPTTGVAAMAVLPVAALAGAAVIVAKKRK